MHGQAAVKFQNNNNRGTDMSGEAGSVPAAHADFERMIASFSACEDAAQQEQMRLSIWDRYGTVGATFISDMANFSSTSRVRGICHFLKLIHRTRETVAPIIADNGGQLLKVDADNCYAYFEGADKALQASIDINAELFRLNQARDLAEHIFLSVGIDFGRLLLIGHEEFFGDPVNTASKLGEDLAGRSETLVTERALETTDYVPHENAERMVARISDIEINYVKLPMAGEAAK